eukprot:6199830-Pleurochrysis_carterae.AAC.1
MSEHVKVARLCMYISKHGKAWSVSGSPHSLSAGGAKNAALCKGALRSGLRVVACLVFIYSIDTGSMTCMPRSASVDTVAQVQHLNQAQRPCSPDSV